MCSSTPTNMDFSQREIEYAHPARALLFSLCLLNDMTGLAIAAFLGHTMLQPES